MPPSFDTPRFDQAFLPEPSPYPRTLMQRLSFEVGYVVLITGGVATPAPGQVNVNDDEIVAADAGSGNGGKAYFSGGRTYTVTAGEKTILEAAGYTVDA